MNSTATGVRVWREGGGGAVTEGGLRVDVSSQFFSSQFLQWRNWRGGGTRTTQSGDLLGTGLCLTPPLYIGQQQQHVGAERLCPPVCCLFVLFSGVCFFFVVVVDVVVSSTA